MRGKRTGERERVRESKGEKEENGLEGMGERETTGEREENG